MYHSQPQPYTRGRGRGYNNYYRSRPQYSPHSTLKLLSEATTQKWSNIPLDESTLVKLDILTTTASPLKKEGYILGQPDQTELWNKMRCQNCGARMKGYRPRGATAQRLIMSDDRHESGFVADRGNPEWVDTISRNEVGEGEALADVVERVRTDQGKVKHTCMFHKGRFSYGEWDCCGGRGGTQGCSSEVHHRPCSEEELYSIWRFEASPEVDPSSQEELRAALSGVGSNTAFEQSVSAELLAPTTGVLSGMSAIEAAPKQPSGGRRGRYMNLTHLPAIEQPQAKRDSIAARQTGGTAGMLDMLNSGQSVITTTSKRRKAVALDCEMGTSTTNSSELIRISMIDLFDTSKPLLDTLVKPDVEMAHYNTRFSGVTFRMMNDAIRNRTCLLGVDAARRKVFEHIDQDTYIVVHGGSSDFSSLRWLHPAGRIIDTYILEKWEDAAMLTDVFDERRKLWLKARASKTLKDTAARRAGIEVQKVTKEVGYDGRVKKLTGHDSLEDAFAAREVVAWWLQLMQDSDSA